MKVGNTSRWGVYLLESRHPERRTYVGATLNIAHRLRQHRREIKGGARSTTRAKFWLLNLFIDIGKQSDALKFERILKKRGRSGIKKRRETAVCLALQFGYKLIDHGSTRAAICSNLFQNSNKSSFHSNFP